MRTHDRVFVEVAAHGISVRASAPMAPGWAAIRKYLSTLLDTNFGLLSGNPLLPKVMNVKPLIASSKGVNAKTRGSQFGSKCCRKPREQTAKRRRTELSE